MAQQRWKFGNYQFTYNPKSNQRQLRATTGEQVTVHGIVSNPNKFFDNEIDIVFDIYDKPTYYEATPIKSTFNSNNYYNAITEKRTTGDLWCLRTDGMFDIVGKSGNMISEGTRNLITNRTFIGWNLFSGSAVTLTQNYSFPEYSSNTATRIQISGGSQMLKYYCSIATPVSGSVYSHQIKVKNIGTNPMKVATQYSTAIVNPNEVKFIQQTITGNGFANYQMRFEAVNSISDSLDFIAYQPQAEKMPYTTEFVNGNRNYVGSLASGNAIAMTHMDDKIATIFNNGTTGNVVICDENIVQISKYTVIDNDYLNASSVAWDYSATNIYVLSKYGKIFKTDISNGTTTLVKQFDDYNTNQINNISAYYGIHFYNGFIGYIKDNRLYYLDSNFDIVYSNEIPQVKNIGKIVAMSYGSFTGDYAILHSNYLSKFYPNVCGVDIERIKLEMANGIVPVVDDKNYVINFMVHSMSEKRLRNKQDARYEITLSGLII